MDSITHLFLGGAIAAAIAPASQRRAALLAGAVLNTLPDLDVLPLILSQDPVVRMTWHRSASHSLLVLPWVGLLLWLWFRRRGGRVSAAPVRWFWIFQCALLSHPLIDAFTVYGTQLLWPLPVQPVMWSSLFIIDPLFTLPLVVACVLAWRWQGLRGTRVLAAGLALSCVYLGWSLVAKVRVDSAFDRALATAGLADAPRFSVPMPFTTWRWRVVAMTPGGYVEGVRGVAEPASAPILLHSHGFDATALAAARSVPAVQRLLWFNRGFMRADVVDGQLVLTDLRMGIDPDYFFRFAVATRDGAGWRAIPPRQ